MRSITGFAKTITNWQLLNDNLKPHLTEMPHAQALAAELETLITQARSIDSEQEIARGKLRDLTAKRRDAEKQGETLRRRLASFLKGSFGFTSAELIQFGINPRPVKTRPRKPAEPPVEVKAPKPAAQ